MLAEALHIHGGNGAALHGPAAGLQPAFADGEAFVWDDVLGVNAHEHPQARALFAGPERVVEGEHPGGQLVHADAVLWAGVVLGECDVLSVNHIDNHNAPSEPGRHLNGVCQPGADVCLDHQPVHHNFHCVLLVLVQGDGLVQIIKDTIHPGPDKAGLPGSVKLLLMGALAAPDHRSQHLYLGFFFQGQHLVHNLVHSLLLDFPAADRAVGHADAGIQQAQVVVNLRDRAYSRAGVFGGGLLVNGDGWGEAVNLVHIRLFHLAQEHPGVRGQALHISALALSIDGVKGQGGLS